MGMKQPTPISVRPRKGSELERIWLEEERNPARMREYFHSWAIQFSEQARKEEGEE